MRQRLPDWGAAEAEVAREWRWLHDALNEIARVRAEQGDAQAFRLMQAQAMGGGQRRGGAGSDRGMDIEMRARERKRTGGPRENAALGAVGSRRPQRHKTRACCC